jgi:hypothetical protein
LLSADVVHAVPGMDPEVHGGDGLDGKHVLLGERQSPQDLLHGVSSARSIRGGELGRVGTLNRPVASM